MNFFVLTTGCLFESWHDGAAHFLFFLLLAVPGEGENPSATSILMIIGAQYTKITIIVVITVQNVITSLVGDHPARELASGQEQIPSRQHLENELCQLN